MLAISATDRPPHRPRSQLAILLHQKCKSSKSPKFSMPVLARCRFPLNHPHERPGRDLAETPPFVPCGPKKGAKNLILAKRRAAAPKYAQSSAAAGGGKGNALCGAVHLYYRCGSLRPLPPGKKTQLLAPFGADTADVTLSSGAVLSTTQPTSNPFASALPATPA